MTVTHEKGLTGPETPISFKPIPLKEYKHQLDCLEFRRNWLPISVPFTQESVQFALKCSDFFKEFLTSKSYFRAGCLEPRGSKKNLGEIFELLKGVKSFFNLFMEESISRFIASNKCQPAFKLLTDDRLHSLFSKDRTEVSSDNFFEVYEGLMHEVDKRTYIQNLLKVNGAPLYLSFLKTIMDKHQTVPKTKEERDPLVGILVSFGSKLFMGTKDIAPKGGCELFHEGVKGVGVRTTKSFKMGDIVTGYLPLRLSYVFSEDSRELLLSNPKCAKFILDGYAPDQQTELDKFYDELKKRPDGLSGSTLSELIQNDSGCRIRVDSTLASGDILANKKIQKNLSKSNLLGQYVNDQGYDQLLGKEEYVPTCVKNNTIILLVEQQGNVGLVLVATQDLAPGTVLGNAYNNTNLFSEPK